MGKNQTEQKVIYVYADWEALGGFRLMGTLFCAPSRGKEVFSFEYDPLWFKSTESHMLDPNLRFFAGPQYPKIDHPNFGLFLDSSPDRFGRALMRRREEQSARDEKRPSRVLMESDYLLGVFDGHRMGALRFKRDPQGVFLDDNKAMASPPWTQLRELEYASLQLEKDNVEKDRNYLKWLNLLIAPGRSLGGARPKASVIDNKGALWIAKFPSRNDHFNTGAWEFLVHQLAVKAKIMVPTAQLKKFTGDHHTFLTQRFDRHNGRRLHFASAMTLLDRKDGDDAEDGASYLDLVDFLIQNGSQIDKDLAELWRRIIFNMVVSNTDDHLRNHGFILTPKGWKLAPAYDMNPSETGEGLTLNISKDDNAQSLELAFEVAPYFRLTESEAQNILSEVVGAVREWKRLADHLLSSREIAKMQHAFRVT